MTRRMQQFARAHHGRLYARLVGAHVVQDATSCRTCNTNPHAALCMDACPASLKALAEWELLVIVSNAFTLP